MIEVNYNEYKETLAQNMRLIIKNSNLEEKIKKVVDILHEINVFEINEDAYNIISKALNVLEEHKNEDDI